MIKRSQKKTGQSTIEYLLLITAVIIVVLFFTRKDGPFEKALNESINISINSMDGFSNRLFN